MQVFADFKSLPVSERIQLVEDIWDSIAMDTVTGLDLTPDDRAELTRRVAQHQERPETSIPWDQVRASLFTTNS